jgi:histidinol phosphatase-like enzyme (inositol monophosphatase family)
MNLSVEIALAQRLADVAGGTIRPHFRTSLDAERKQDATPVTIADRAAEEAMRVLIEAEFPADGIIGEEFGAHNPTASRQWVLDPIDGTTSFLAGRATFGTLIGLVIDGFPVLGVIDQPVLRERWVGVAGQATIFNGSEVHTRPCKELSAATLATTGPHYFSDGEGAQFMALAARTNHKCMLMGGDCYNYALLASGHIDIVCEAGLKLHDFAALAPIVEGAGGTMCDWRGEPLHAASDGRVLALGDAARLDDVLAALESGAAHRH